MQCKHEKVKMCLVYVICICACLSVTSAAQSNNCDHGQVEEQKCICDNPFPASGEIGYTGESCNIPIYHSSPGTRITDSCSKGGCNTLKSDAFACFAVPFNATSTDWHYFSILLNKTVTDGDPDLYGYFYDAEDAHTIPSFQTLKGFDFQQTTTRSASVVTLSDIEPKFSGAVLCAHNYAKQDTEFTLSATLSPCPSTFDLYNGDALMCHTRDGAAEEDKRYSECTAEGECICKPPYNKPVEEVFSGLGFEDCSAPVVAVPDDDLATYPYSASNEKVRMDHWKYYSFKITEEDYQVVVTVVQDEESPARVDLFAKAGSPPGFKANQFDMRPAWDSATGGRSVIIKIDPKDDAFRPGQWFVGVIGGSEGWYTQYDITIEKYACPMGCSSNGQCDAASHTCTCNQGFSGDDCSVSHDVLQYGQAIEHNASFEYEYYKLPSVTEAMLTGNVELVIKASTEGPLYAHHLEAKPAILIKHTTEGDVLPFPTLKNFTHRLVLDADNVERTLTLGASQLEAGEYNVAVYNPLPSYPLTYKLLVSKVLYCLNNCTQPHGVCNENGVCECSTGWLGGDCSVDESKFDKKAQPSAFLAFWRRMFYIGLGSVCTFGYIHFKGVPTWLPIRMQGGLGLYQELTETEGI